MVNTLVYELANALRQRGWLLSTAESCTGGMIAAACTELPGSSEWFDRGFVTYSNAAKTDLLGVDARLLESQGAVSEAVARAMAEGALQRSLAQIGVAVTGIAGPSGASPGKPVGTVWLAVNCAGTISSERQLFAGDRAVVRAAALRYALEMLLRRLRAHPPNSGPKS